MPNRFLVWLVSVDGLEAGIPEPMNDGEPVWKGNGYCTVRLEGSEKEMLFEFPNGPCP
jgi:hypothetical protein